MRQADGRSAKLPIFIFDFGGVLIKWKNNDPIFDHVAKRYGVPLLAMRRELELSLPTLETGDVPVREFLERALGRFGKHLKEGDSPDELWTRPFQRLVKTRLGAVEVVKSLRGRGYRVYLFSNTSLPHARFARREGWGELFDGFLTSCELRSMKPSPEAFARALDKIGARPSQVVFVDDREVNVRGAREFGIRVALRFTSIARLKKDIGLSLVQDWSEEESI